MFIQSPNGQVTINAVPGSSEVSLIRKIPNVPNAVEFKTSRQVSEIIRMLCRKPVKVGRNKMLPGLNVSYAETIAILKQMCEKGAIPATFRAGPLPQSDQTTQ
jgi:hypothetical protein